MKKEEFISKNYLLKNLGNRPENWTDTDSEIQEQFDYDCFKNLIDTSPVVFSCLAWEEVKGFVTPGGDAVWRCPVCKNDLHIMGIEHLNYYHNHCLSCGEYLLYPYEFTSED